MLFRSSMMKTIEDKYAETGKKLWGKPFKPPHILFWNLRTTAGFPSLSNQRNATMMSGFSPSSLNIFCKDGLSGLQSITPWTQLNKTLNNERYKPLDEYLKCYFKTQNI